MTTVPIAAVLLIAVPLLLAAVSFLLKRVFDYPDILRRTTAEVLTRFRAGGSGLVALWYVFVVAALLFIPLAALIPGTLAPGRAGLTITAAIIGVLAGVVRVLGLIRWPFLVPHLARAYTAPDSTPATKDAVAAVFQAFDRYTGAALGEHVRHLLSGVWTLLVSVALTTSGLVPTWLAAIGVLPAAGILAGLLERAGLKTASSVNALAYVVWSVWLIAVGAVLLLTGAAT